jgi:hypothetical protein
MLNPTLGLTRELTDTAPQKVCGAHASWVLLALLVLPAAAFPTSAIAGKLCRTITMTHPPGAHDCEQLCLTILQSGQTNGRRKWWNGLATPGSSQFVSGPISGAPKEVHYTPSDITSCNASVSTVAPSGIVGACTIAMCGPAPVRNSKKHPYAKLDVSRYNAPKPKIGPPHPDTGTATVKATAKVGGSNATMDRLSGDNQFPTANNPVSKASGRLPASGGASAIAKPVAPSLPKSDPTSDLGKCASCGKPSAPPR